MTIWAVNLWVYVAYFRVVILHIRTTGTIPNPAFPKSVNDKFLWRKIFDRNPDFVPLSDKLESQVIARKKCPGVRVPKTLWVGRQASDIPPELLTGNVLVKASHGSGFVIPIFNGKYDRRSLEEETADWMGRTYGRRHWEWGYFGLEPKLYVEEM
ncbi:MAG: ATP-grasp fold amidoligase family protein, partial [Pseudomonadota bacterium]